MIERRDDLVDQPRRGSVDRPDPSRTGLGSPALDVGSVGGVTPRRPTPGRRWLRRAFAASAIVLALFVAASLVLFVWPPTNQPRRVDGILSLNGDNEIAREALALSLARRGYAPVVLFSLGSNATPCPRSSGFKIVCFDDVSNNTRGEARWAGHYAEVHHWQSMMIVPGRPQATRARLMVERCFSGQVLVVPAAEPLLRFPLDVLHEWGGLVQALLLKRSC